MKKLLLTIAGLAAVVAIAGCASTSQPAASSACPGWTASDYAKGPVLRVFRVYTDPRTRDSAVEIKPMPPKSTLLPMTQATLYQYNFGPGSKTQIVVGPPRLDIPMKPAPYRESFLLLEGSVTLRLGDGSTYEQGPGDMITFEDTDAIKGHGAVTGPCGYVSLNIVP